jgi:tryptophan synthase alpha chain
LSRLQQKFDWLAREGRTGLIPYVTAGDPARESVVRLMHTLVKHGADVIELGVPFSDPMADGPVIQRSSERALARQVTLADCLGWVREFRSSDAATPIVLMGYANPVERFGIDRFVTQAKESGVDGTIVVDYPPEECEEFSKALKSRGMDPIFLLAPTSTESRMRDVARLGAGYLYYVSLKGVTGAGHLDSAAVGDRVQQIRRFTSMPIAVGFGISNADSAVAVAQHADAVVIGSALIRVMEEAVKTGSDTLSAAAGFISGIRQALDRMPKKMHSEAA